MMKNRITRFLLQRFYLAVFPVWLSVFVFPASAQIIALTTAAFTTNDSAVFLKKNYPDQQWKTISTTTNWENQGFEGYNGYAWYRMKFPLPLKLKSTSLWKDSLRIYLSKIDDCTEIYLNEQLIRKSGSFPYEKDGYASTWNTEQEIHLSTKNPILHWDKENTIAIRVYDGGGGGGIFGNTPFVNMIDRIDGIGITEVEIRNNRISCTIQNMFNEQITGSVTISVKESDKHFNRKIIVKGNATEKIVSGVLLNEESRIAILTFVDFATQKQVEKIFYIPYIRTPKPAAGPAINTPDRYGARKGNPFLYKIPATGIKPLVYTIKNLPEGLSLSNDNMGIIRGVLNEEGDFPIEITVSNTAGSAIKKMQIVCNKNITLTPPMGWNSWNCWGLRVSAEKVKASAQAMIDKRLVDYGWNYINIDDGWEAEKRNENGTIAANEKFPNMKELGNWLHENGLKFGIYSSPGPLTCGGFLGSYQHEIQDAATYANWGIDYLKYDWCSYETIHGGKDTSLASYKKPFETMRDALQKQNRDMVYSLCQYGMKDVWKWGASVGGNLWRTTGDIADNWESLYGIGFSQTKQQDDAKPGGGFNDPDMLVVGKVGWGENLHDTRLTPDEQYTHLSLWCLLNAPLLIGCDMSKLDDFTLNLLTNAELIAMDQNTNYKPATPWLTFSNYQVWVKRMQTDEYAIGIFNTAPYTQYIVVDLLELLQNKIGSIRDVWQQKEESLLKGSNKNYRAIIPGHGVQLITVQLSR
jgi:hypothetical protein